MAAERNHRSVSESTSRVSLHSSGLAEKFWTYITQQLKIYTFIEPEGSVLFGPLESILSQLNPVDNLTLHFYKMPFNIIPPSTSRFPKSRLPFVFRPKFCMLPPAAHMFYAVLEASMLVYR